MTVAAVEQKQRVVLIDLSSLFHPAWRANENGPLSVAFSATLDAVTRCAKKDPNALTAICLDSRKSWRKDLVPTYKAQREKLGNDFYDTLNRVKERLRADGYLLWESEGFEADDVIATACEEAIRRGHPVAICSADKDLMQLLRPGVKQLRTHDWSVWSELEAEAKFGVKMSQLGDWLALVGDASDNIKGCQGVGEKRATAMLQTNGDWAGIVKALEEKQFTPAMTAALQGFDYATTRKLIELRRDVPINFDDLYSGRSVKPIVKLEEPPVEDVPSSVIAAEKVFGVKAETAHIAPEPEPATVAIGELVDMPKPPASNDTKALAAPAPNPALQPNSVADAYWLAKAMMNSRLYTKFGNPEAILATMIRGKELGFPVLTSLDMFHVIQGRPSLSANAIQAMAERLPECEFLRCVKSDSKSAEWETKHRKHGKQTQFEYTIDDAVAAGLATPEPAPPPPPGKDDRRGQWDKRRKEMLRKTAMVQLVRMVYPSAALGLYAREELTDREED
jgi:DNA polymerase-1